MLFVWYARDLAHWNALYGTVSGLVAFLIWVYISGWIFVLGVCGCVAQAELDSKADATNNTKAAC
jgi:uncharacterized BrkB/YihY/UPF0761 family membrane protein